MKNVLKTGMLPWFALICGELGLALRIWLYAGVDQKGLLPAGHIASVLAYVLTALVFAGLFLCVRLPRPLEQYPRLLPAAIARMIGCAAGVIGVLSVAIFQYNSADVLSLLCLVLGVLAAAGLVWTAVCRQKNSPLTFWGHLAITVFLIFYTVGRCRLWGAEPQVQEYIFPLLACVFLMLTGYYRAVSDTGMDSGRGLVFFNQAAVYCCCLSLIGENRLFYMGMILWLVLDLCPEEQIKIPTAPSAEEE